MKHIGLFSWLYVLTCWFGNANGQALSGPETVRRYSIAQQRLLVLSTARFLDLVTVHNLDGDSLRSMACRITGLPWLLPYTEGLDTATGPIPALLRKVIRFLHWPSHPAAYPDSAKRYIQKAMRYKDNRWQNACLLLLGDYYYRIGRIKESINVFRALEASGRKQGNQEIVASAWERLGRMKENGDSLNLAYLNNSLGFYRQLSLREKEMELLWDIAALHITSEIPLAQNDLERILTLEQATGFRHTLFVEYLLAFTATMQTRHLDALSHCQAALENLQWSGFSILKPTFFTRMGATYFSFNKDEEALSWFEKALDLRTKETHFFWYKSLLYMEGILVKLGRPGDCLRRFQAVVSEFPPITPWEKMQVNVSIGECLSLLSKPDSADRFYRTVLDLSNRYPSLDGQFASNYYDMASFYVSRGNSELARIFLAKGVTVGDETIVALVDKARLLYKLDSLEGKFRTALQDHIRYKELYDSNENVDQLNRLQELQVKFSVEKKDQDIKYLRQQEATQQLESRQTKLVRNILIAVAGFFLVTIGLLFSRYRLKQRTNKRLEAQQEAINEQNLALRHLVQEKEWLVKEIHHRVKNNFQTVMGLLGTQCGYLNSQTAINAIRDSQQRIQAMSLIHQRLYRTENLSTVSMPEYVHELVHFLRESFAVGPLIRFRLDIESINLNLEHSIPLGLILNEAITNSFKYAFLHAKEGVISISFSHITAQQFQLIITDNGAGLPTGFDVSQSNSMGMNLMHGLCREIDADIRITSHPGTQITIEFDYDAEFSTRSAVAAVRG